MTNFEKQLEVNKDAIIEAVAETCGVNKESNMLTDCKSLSCDKCIFFDEKDCACLHGAPLALDWLNAEYEEPLPDTVRIPRDTPKHTPIWVKDFKCNPWTLKFFSHFDSVGYPICFVNGYFDSVGTASWTYAKPFEIGVNPNEDEKEE